MMIVNNAVIDREKVSIRFRLKPGFVECTSCKCVIVCFAIDPQLEHGQAKPALVIGGKVELHPLLLLFALLGGLQAFGFIGIFIGPLVISLIAALTAMLREELQELNETPADTALRRGKSATFLK